jgi:rhodanese-related sulfurtransferase
MFESSRKVLFAAGTIIIIAAGSATVFLNACSIDKSATLPVKGGLPSVDIPSHLDDLPATGITQTNTASKGYADLLVQEAKQLMDMETGITLLDVRNQTEYDSGHLQGALLIPLPELEERIHELDPGAKTVVYCGSGSRSAKASNILVEHGFTSIYNVLGGLAVWETEGYPIVVTGPGKARE